jgi:hypothetical protein
MRKNGLKGILFVALVFTACITGPGLGDWRYKLPNGYEMWQGSPESVVIGLLSSSGYTLSINENNWADGVLIGVPNTIIDFCHNERYVGARTIPIEYLDLPETEYVYYIVDTEMRHVYGPMNEQEYVKTISDERFGDLGRWISTRELVWSGNRNYVVAPMESNTDD